MILGAVNTALHSLSVSETIGLPKNGDAQVYFRNAGSDRALHERSPNRL